MSKSAGARLIPANPEFEAMVRDSFARQPMMTTLGAQLTRVAPGEVEVTLDHQPGLTQQHGFLHAGAISSIADSACGYAAYSLAPAGSDVLAVEFKISLLAPARAPAFRARARVLRAGRTLTTCQAQVHGIGGPGHEQGGEELVAVMLSTIIIRGRP
jgi:uncharacterized protein (TIGR00369 family)